MSDNLHPMFAEALAPLRRTPDQLSGREFAAAYQGGRQSLASEIIGRINRMLHESDRDEHPMLEALILKQVIADLAAVFK